MSNLIDVTENELITADRQNLINQYIEHGTHRINTLSLNIGGTETISSGRIGDFLGLSIGNFNGILKATNGTVSVATLNTDYIKDLSIFTTDDLTEGLTNFYDKIVSLTAGVGISVSGTYPNFTITNTGEANSFIAGNGIDIVESPDDTFTFSVDESYLSLSNFGEKSHTSLTDIGSNSHAQIDSDLSRLENTSGTNTGDQDLSGLLPNSHLTDFVHSDIAHTNRSSLDLVSGTNTGDQDLSGLVPYTGATSDIDLGSNNITASNLSGTNTGDQDLSGLLPNSHLTDFTHSDIAHTNRSSLDLVSGTNTGDQVLPTRDSLGLDTDDIVTFANLSGTNTGDQTLPVNSDFNLSDLGDVDDTDKAEGKILKVNSAGTHVYVNDESGTDEKVKYDVNDPTAGYLADKFIAGSGISLAEGTSADENKLVITNSDKGSDVDLSGLVPYSGATTNVDLGSNDLDTTGDITAGTFNSGTLSGNNSGDQDLSPYWKSDGSSTATGDWDLGDNDFSVEGNTTQGSGEGVDSPASGSLTFDYTTGYSYYNYGMSYVYTVYAYKVIDGTKIYSSGLALSGTDNGNMNSSYVINLAWDAVTGVDGYKIVMTNDEWISSFNAYYFETTETTLTINDPLGYIGAPDPEFVYEVPMVVTPNLILTSHEIVGNLSIGGTLAVNTNNFVVNSNGKVGIGTNSPISMLNINQEAKSLRGLTITGYGYASTSPYSATDGIAIYMNYNGTNNRQTVIGSTDAIGSSSLGVFRFLTGAVGYANLDAVSGDGSNRLLTIMGTDTTNVGVGYAESNGTGADFTGRLSVFTSTKSGSRTNLLIRKFGTASGNYIDVKNSANTSLFKIDSTGRVGIGTVTPQQALDVTGRGYLRQATSSSPLAWDFVKSGGATMATFFVAGASNQFLNGSVAGDSGFRAMGGKFLIGAGPTVDIAPAIAMTVETDGEIRFPNDYVAGGAGSLLFGAGGDAGMGYNGTNFLINPKVVGSGYVNIQGQTLLDDKLMFTQVDGNEYIDSLADGYLDLGATTGIRLKQDTTLDEDKDLNLSGTGFVDSPKYKAGGTEPVTDGTYTVGIGGTQNGTITIKGGIITAVQEAVA